MELHNKSTLNGPAPLGLATLHSCNHLRVNSVGRSATHRVRCDMEVWKPIPGYEGRYEASDLGRIRSLIRKKIRILRLEKTRSGRLKVCISINSESEAKRFYVSRLVTSAFYGPCPDGMECCHSNGKKEDNRASNLRWDTHDNNIIDKLGCGIARVKNIKMLISLGYRNAEIAKIFNVPNGTVSDIRRGKYWKNVAA